jgi:HAD superfamily hydrolase (TIGR01549 family)
MPQPPSAILFDLDGTLIDTYRLHLECYRRALAPYLYREPTDAEIVARQPSERGRLAEWIGERYADECHEAVWRHYGALHASLGEGPYDGVLEMLAALRSAGYPLGIVTGKRRGPWEVTERDLALGPFAVVVTGDEVAAYKPDPQGLLAAAKAMDVEPARCVYVGDALGDLHAGRNAGMRVAAALWPKTGPGEAERFVNEAAPYAPAWTFARPADLTRAFAAWC